MQKFKTGIFCWMHEIKSKKLINGKYFKFYFDEKNKNSTMKDSRELIIKANSIERAQQAFGLFVSSFALKNAEPLERFNDFSRVYDYNLAFDNPRINFFDTHYQFSTNGIYAVACLAARVSFTKRLYYSIYKYHTATSLHSNNIMDLDPTRREYYKLSRDPLDHIRYAYAIQIFYSILEELGLEIRASNNKPSKIGDDWNPKVKADLENRLKNAGVDITKKVMWNIRTKRTKIHRHDKLILQQKEKWARYSVRDSEMEIIDAISYISWLRSKIIAHKFSDGILSISIYDVASANFLIRQILLDILKIY